MLLFYRFVASPALPPPTAIFPCVAAETSAVNLHTGIDIQTVTASSAIAIVRGHGEHIDYVFNVSSTLYAWLLAVGLLILF